MINLPVTTLSPTLIKISFTTPATGAGTSIDALSPSTLMIDWSTSTVSPTFTIISVTFTSSEPISGTLTSTTLAAAGAAAGAGAAAAGAGAGAVAAASADSKTSIGVPVVTLSPTFTNTSFTTPASGAGTSIEALSPSTLIIL